MATQFKFLNETLHATSSTKRRNAIRISSIASLEALVELLAAEVAEVQVEQVAEEVQVELLDVAVVLVELLVAEVALVEPAVAEVAEELEELLVVEAALVELPKLQDQQQSEVRHNPEACHKQTAETMATLYPNAGENPPPT